MEKAEHQERRDRGTDRRAAVEQCNRPSTFTSRKPLRDRFRGSGPIACLTGAEEKPEEAKRPQAAGERRQHRRHGVPRDGDAQPRARPDRIEEPPRTSLPERIRHSERDHDQREIRVAPPILVLQRRPEDAERLAIDVIDDGGKKKKCANPPAQTATRGNQQWSTVLSIAEKPQSASRAQRHRNTRR